MGNETKLSFFWEMFFAILLLNRKLSPFVHNHDIMSHSNKRQSDSDSDRNSHCMKKAIQWTNGVQLDVGF